MKNSSIVATSVALLALGGCIGQPEVDQIAQQKMIGLPAKRIIACLGAPAKKMIVGGTQIWTYPHGDVWVEGGPFSPGVNGMASLLGNDRLCNVNIVLTNGAVSQVNYTAPDGGPLRLGEQCIFPASDCAEFSVVSARY